MYLRLEACSTHAQPFFYGGHFHGHGPLKCHSINAGSCFTLPVRPHFPQTYSAAFSQQFSELNIDIPCVHTHLYLGILSPFLMRS